ncbi:hypothetical protein GCM10009119_08920 [Algoriphagus jejuensis]|uniref:PKD domain-containing protein n=2 Tax=Algoriphagus jejuensis TaxID=419934 RepID=A0ABP3Y8S8_9BACT
MAACEQKATMPDTLPFQVAKAYGFENIDQVKSIAYTWNVQRDSVNVLSRNWKWNIKDSTVSYSGPDTTFTYSLTADSLPKQDGGFINDRYWAMMPFQLAWDKGYTFETSENATSPIKGIPSTKLTILYNSGEKGAPGMGYTPGDAYDLYVDENLMIVEWVFRRGNSAEGRPVTWETVESHGPLKFSTEHYNAEGKRTLWISDIKVE